MTSFVPTAGAQYLASVVAVYPNGCSVRIERIEDGQAVPEPSAQVKRVRSVFPMYPTGSYCHPDK